MKKFYYLTTLSTVFLLPTLVAGFFISKYISLWPLIPFIITVTIIGSIWDIWATKHGKKDQIWIWQFNDKETLGFKVFGLPIEEYVFYTVSSVYVIFMWEGIKLITITNNFTSYMTVLLLGGWTLPAITIPYLISPKRDKLI